MLFFLLGLREDKILAVILSTLAISLSENGATLRKAGKTQDMQMNPLTAFVDPKPSLDIQYQEKETELTVQWK